MKTIILLVIGVMAMGCSNFGSPPSDKDKVRFESSRHYNKEKGIFVNRRPDVIEEMRKNSFSWSLIWEWFRGTENAVPTKPLPEVKPDLASFVEPSDKLKVIWFGHSTFLLSMDGKVILVDPVFGNSASPFSFMVKRFQEPVLTLEELPEIDFVVISHDHYDHLEKLSSEFFAKKSVTYIVPLGVGSHLKGWGVKPENIIEKDWWQSEVIGGVEFTAAPSQHFSGRDGLHDNETLWASWAIKTKNHKVYFSGDSGYDIHFKEIGEKLGPFDLALLENGQYNPRWKAVHLFPEEAVQAYFDLNAKALLPVHWGMFELSLHTWDEPIVRISKEAQLKGANLVTPRIGEILTVSEGSVSSDWWNSL